MVQEETYEALLLVRQQDRDVTMVRKSGNSNIKRHVIDVDNDLIVPLAFLL